jgi:hypothetical protein
MSTLSLPITPELRALETEMTRDDQWRADVVRHMVNFGAMTEEATELVRDYWHQVAWAEPVVAADILVDCYCF